MGYLGDEILADNPYLYWPLNDTSGTTAQDASPNNRDGSTVGGLTLGTVDPDFGYVAHLDGSNDAIGRALGATVQIKAAEVWFNSDVNLTAEGTLRGLMYGDTTADWSVAFGAVTGSLTNELLTMFHGGSGSRFWAYTGAGLSVASGAWHHVVVTYVPASSGWRVFLDAVDVTDTILGGDINGSFGISQFGLGDWFTGGGPFDGKVAHAAIYAGELSAARISAHYNADKLPATTTRPRLRGGQVIYGELRGGQRWV